MHTTPHRKRLLPATIGVVLVLFALLSQVAPADAATRRAPTRNTQAPRRAPVRRATVRSATRNPPPPAPPSPCAAALAMVHVPQPYELRCLTTSYPEGWTVEAGRAAGTDRVGQCVCAPGHIDWIEVDANLSTSRLAFTIAHELGHAYAAMHGGPWTSEPYADNYATCALTTFGPCG